MKTHLNLLPPSVHRRNVLRGCIRLWMLLWIVAVLLIGGACWSLQQSIAADLQQLRTKEEDARVVNELLASLKELKSQLAASKGRQTMTAAAHPSVVSMLSVVSDSSQRCNGRLYVKHLSLMRGDSTAKNELASPSGITLIGFAVDNLVIAKFVSLLRDAGTFTEVDLKSSVAAASMGNLVHAYTIECGF